jgi:exoribonuclease R
MMPHDIMEKASLMDNRHGSIKPAVTVTTEIDKNTFQPIGQIKLLFTKIQVTRENSLSYSQAARDFYNNDVIYICLKISESLQSLRKRETKAVVLNEVANSYVTFDNNEPVLYSDSPTEILMKHMIAEFAIFANSFIGEYLKINFHSSGLYRICPAKDWLHTLDDSVSGQDLLNEIITNGIKAEYMSTVQSHDLVGAPEYVHFTSPIRRLTDCVCHYLLKYIHLKTTNNDLAIPFTDNQLEEYSTTCSVLSKKMKNNQYTDIKFRMIQVIKRLLLDNQEVSIQYYVSSYKNGFLNIIINKLNNHGIYFSYTLRIAHLDSNYIVKTPNTIKITSVNAPNKFDQGTLPDLDNIFM